MNFTEIYESNPFAHYNSPLSPMLLISENRKLTINPRAESLDSLSGKPLTAALQFL